MFVFSTFTQTPWFPWSGLTRGRSRESWVISFNLVSRKKKGKKEKAAEKEKLHQLNDAERHLMSLSSLRQHGGDSGLMCDCKM